MLGVFDKIKFKFLTKRRLFLATLTIFATIGVYSLGVGIWLYLERTDFHELTPSSFSAFSTAGLCCSTGVAVWIICTVGFISATAYNQRLLYTFKFSEMPSFQYIGFVILLAFIQTITGLLGFTYKDATREHVRMDLLHNINRTALVTGNGRVFDLTVSWDRLQKSLQCCGVNDESDWFYSNRWPSHKFVPDSCCDPKHFSDIDSMANCGKVENSTLLFQQGCFEVFADWLYHHVSIMNWISFALLIAEVGSLAIAVPLSKSESFKVGASHTRNGSFFSRDEYHRCLVEMNDLETRDLRTRPMDRIGDARQDPVDIVN
ncbi:tetraspanin family protein [Ostertagia ostertagi]